MTTSFGSSRRSTMVVRCFRSIFSQPAHSFGRGAVLMLTFSVQAVAVQPERAATKGTAIAVRQISLFVPALRSIVTLATPVLPRIPTGQSTHRTDCRSRFDTSDNA
ncbi:Hypothetical protein, conserved [Brucella canis ATCC 23365]|uniref:Uncharacterized protein n=3 Tax=Brucella TaxID=234 RepID=C0RFP3_BRUMB|nr:Hypothetical protein, conserved [Brucella canis ATCC 23365]ABY38855.1 Hypothetical protein, conserved [Brucella suis ATCC 23445]ACO01715.1 Hypothetical protein, conserved [Brucella melitensis ATCC 23457]